MNKKLLLGAIALAPFLLLTGCASNGPKNTNPASQPEQAVQASLNNAAATQTKPAPLEVTKEKSVAVSTTENNKFPLTDIVETKPIEKPATLVFQFGFDKQKLNNEAKAILMQHADYLSANSNLILKVKGHSDTRGPRTYNELLSKERANSVATMLIEYGATPGQLQVIGKGDSEPLNDVDNFNENRRVELQYLDLQTADTDSDTQQLLSKQ